VAVEFAREEEEEEEEEEKKKWRENWEDKKKN
jgi:hypothetical protein